MTMRQNDDVIGPKTHKNFIFTFTFTFSE